MNPGKGKVKKRKQYEFTLEINPKIPLVRYQEILDAVARDAKRRKRRIRWLLCADA